MIVELEKNYFWEVISIVYSLMWVDFLKAEYPLKKYLRALPKNRRVRKSFFFFFLNTWQTEYTAAVV